MRPSKIAVVLNPDGSGHQDALCYIKFSICISSKILTPGFYNIFGLITRKTLRTTGTESSITGTIDRKDDRVSIFIKILFPGRSFSGENLILFITEFRAKGKV